MHPYIIFSSNCVSMKKHVGMHVVCCLYPYYSCLCTFLPCQQRICGVSFQVLPMPDGLYGEGHPGTTAGKYCQTALVVLKKLKIRTHARWPLIVMVQNTCQKMTFHHHRTPPRPQLKFAVTGKLCQQLHFVPFDTFDVHHPIGNQCDP